MSLPTIFSLIQSAACLPVHRNCPTNQGIGNAGNSVERDQKLIRPGEAHNEYVHKIWAQSDQRFVGKCVENFHQSESEARKQQKLECAASNGNRYPPYPQVMATAISQ